MFLSKILVLAGMLFMSIVAFFSRNNTIVFFAALLVWFVSVAVSFFAGLALTNVEAFHVREIVVFSVAIIASAVALVMVNLKGYIKKDERIVLMLFVIYQIAMIIITYALI